MAKGKAKMITPKQYAEQIETPYSTVMRWLQRDLIPGAEKQELPFGGWYYAIPADAPRPDLKPGPKPKVDTSIASAAPQAPDDGQPLDVTKKKPSKKSRKTAQKKSGR